MLFIIYHIFIKLNKKIKGYFVCYLFIVGILRKINNSLLYNKINKQYLSVTYLSRYIYIKK